MNLNVKEVVFRRIYFSGTRSLIQDNLILRTSSREEIFDSLPNSIYFAEDFPPTTLDFIPQPAEYLHILNL